MTVKDIRDAIAHLPDDAPIQLCLANDPPHVGISLFQVGSTLPGAAEPCLSIWLVVDDEGWDDTEGE